MNKSKTPLALASLFLWVGFVGAISFLESWLKFQAPGITIPLGLGIGRLVFGALNKVEWVFAILIFISLYRAKEPVFSLKYTYFLIPVVILILQTVWVLPVMDARAELRLQGNEVSPSNLHYYFVAMEIIKVACLSLLGIRQLKLWAGKVDE
ncbi:MAG: hypothetical protein J5I52_03720 [Saprospiraceae bacterium]|nr:MAG: hypothetical protein UZ09_BCD002002551 [Bacteroidetes bacterium OLB9]MCO6463237.1 hypothetical protein [Saprospiraceae bacterium]MCZ2338337.1 hypothetical protein [Chitinophagales bacterium]